MASHAENRTGLTRPQIPHNDKFVPLGSPDVAVAVLVLPRRRRRQGQHDSTVNSRCVLVVFTSASLPTNPTNLTEYVHDFSPFSCPIFRRHPEARGCCSQSERLLFGRDTRNLRRFFRRFVGRNRESRSREGAGRRDWPEAVAREMRGMKKDAYRTRQT